MSNEFFSKYIGSPNQANDDPNNRNMLSQAINKGWIVPFEGLGWQFTVLGLYEYAESLPTPELKEEWETNILSYSTLLHDLYQHIKNDTSIGKVLRQIDGRYASEAVLVRDDADAALRMGLKIDQVRELADNRRGAAGVRRNLEYLSVIHTISNTRFEPTQEEPEPEEPDNLIAIDGSAG